MPKMTVVKWRLFYCLLLGATLGNALQAVHPSCFALTKLINDLGPDRVFDVENLKAEDVIRLSAGVYKVRLRSGDFGLLRIDYEKPVYKFKEPALNNLMNNDRSNIHDANFEVFSIQISNLLGKPLPIPMHVIPSKRLKKLMSQLEEDARFPRSEIVTALTTGELKAATILPFYPGVQGVDYLQTTTGMGFRKNLSFLAYAIENSEHRDKFFKSDYDVLFKQLKETWDLTPTDARATILQDMNKLFPGEIFSENNLLAQVDPRLRGQKPKLLREIVLQAFDRIPHEAQVELAESWAIFSVMGIPDFHSGNWIIHEGHITPIDLANRSEEFTNASSDIAFIKQESLLDGNDVSPEFVHKLRSLLSPAFIANLRILSVVEIMKTARAAGINISNVQAEAMVKRAQKLIP